MKKALIIPQKLKKNNIENDFIVLTEKSFHPCSPFFINNAIAPESLSVIETKGVLEKTPYLREILKKTDYLLAVNGRLILKYYKGAALDYSRGGIRSQNKVLNEISLCYKHRYKMIKKSVFDNSVEFEFVKTQGTLHPSDSIDNWSFGIVSDGMKNEKLNKIIDQIEKFHIPAYEILVCGPLDKLKSVARASILDDKDLYWDCRIPISAKKNLIICSAQYENIVIIHDRIEFPEDWYVNIKKYNNYFDVLCTRIVDETKKLRIMDWLEFEGNLSDPDRNGKLLAYNTWTPNVYVDGGHIIGKKGVLKNVLLNKYLNWGEAEDLMFSKALYNDGAMINLYKDCCVFSSSERHPGKKANTWYKEILERTIYYAKVFLKMSYIRNRIKQTIDYSKYLSMDK